MGSGCQGLGWMIRAGAARDVGAATGWPGDETIQRSGSYGSQSMRELGWYTARPVSGSDQARAAWALLLYVLAALILPALHVSFHARPHQHVAHGLRLHPQGAAALGHDETASGHTHDEATVSDFAARIRDGGFASRDTLRSRGATAAPLDVGHGLGSRSHFAESLLATTAQPALRVRDVPFLAPAVWLGRDVPVPAVVVCAHGPRGPPVLLASLRLPTT